MSNERPEHPGLVRALGAWDGVLLTVGSILGSAIFLTTSDMARSVPHAGLILLLWIGGGLVTLTGATAYAELGAMFPEAGGQYVFLREAYGPLAGFLFGWTSFFVIASGGIAALAAGFGEYLGAFFPFFSTGHVLGQLQVGTWKVTATGGQLAGALAIAALTGVNYVGVREGGGIQSALTVLKVGLVLAFCGLGLLAPARAAWSPLSPLPAGPLLPALGVGMIAVFWAYDGWYQLTFSAGELRRPERNLPVGLIAGTAAVTLLYALVNLVYARGLSIPEMARSGRIGEAAAAALLGPAGGRLVSVAGLVSIFGALSAAILACSRIYLPMARDGLFFRGLATVHPRFRTPGPSLVAQGAWSTVLVFSGSYEQLYTYVVFALLLAHAATGGAVFVLRRKRPDAPRPHRAAGYPLVPAVFVVFSLGLALNTLFERPGHSALGLGLAALGIPAFAAWRRRRGGPARQDAR